MRSRSRPHLLNVLLVLAVLTADLPSPRRGLSLGPTASLFLPSVGARLPWAAEAEKDDGSPALRAGQIQESPRTRTPRGLADAVRAAGLEEGALFTGWGAPRRLEPDLFDPSARPFKLLVVAWLRTRPIRTRPAERAVTEAINAVVTQPYPLSETTNAVAVGKVGALVHGTANTSADAAPRLAQAILADVLTAASDRHNALNALRDAVPKAAMVLDTRRPDRQTMYRELAGPVQGALARIVVVERLLSELPSGEPARQAAALRQLQRWLRWPRLRGLPDAVERQAAALVAAVAPLRESPDPRVVARAQQVVALMARRAGFRTVLQAMAVPAAARPDPEPLRARLEALWVAASAMEDVLYSESAPQQTFIEVFHRVANGSRVIPTEISVAQELGALVGILEVKAGDRPVRSWTPDHLALLTWMPEILRVMQDRVQAGQSMDPDAIYRRLETQVAERRQQPADPSEALGEDVTRRFEARLVYWDSERIWPTPAARRGAMEGLITRITTYVGLTTGLEELPRFDSVEAFESAYGGPFTAHDEAVIEQALRHGARRVIVAPEVEPPPGRVTVTVYASRPQWTQPLDAWLGTQRVGDAIFFGVSYPADGRVHTPGLVLRAAGTALPAPPAPAVPILTLRDLDDAKAFTPASWYALATTPALVGLEALPVIAVLPVTRAQTGRRGVALFV